MGKPRTSETDDGAVNVSLRHESLTIVDEATRDRRVSETAERTIARLEAVDDEANEYAAMAREHYGAGVELYRQAVVEAAQSLVEAPADAADETGDATAESPSGQAVESIPNERDLGLTLSIARATN